MGGSTQAAIVAFLARKLGIAREKTKASLITRAKLIENGIDTMRLTPETYIDRSSTTPKSPSRKRRPSLRRRADPTHSAPPFPRDLAPTRDAQPRRGCWRAPSTPLPPTPQGSPMNIAQTTKETLGLMKKSLTKA